LTSAEVSESKTPLHTSDFDEEIGPPENFNGSSSFVGNEKEKKSITVFMSVIFSDFLLFC